MKAYHVKVTGRVQRVGYRMYVQGLGEKYGVAGYVKNEDDGSVTVFVQGDEKAVEEFIAALNQPPPPAHVKQVKAVEAQPIPKLKDFTIRF